MQVRLAARAILALVAGAAYVAGSHWLMTQARASAWNVVALLTPMLLVVAIGAWRGGHRRASACAGLGIAALCLLAISGTQVSPNGLYLAQHAGINLFLAVVFGSTLRAGQVSLITTLALRVHRLTPEMTAYTRKLTRAWTVFFVVIVLVSLALYAFGRFDAWAFFANLLTPVAVAAMFVGEYLVRYRLHPEFERASLADMLGAYMHGPRAPAQPVQRNTVS
jgi:uncharacterized membrane protein